MSGAVLLLAALLGTASCFNYFTPVRICSSQQLYDFIDKLCKAPLLEHPQKRGVEFGSISAEQFAHMCCTNACYPLQFIDLC